MEFISGDCGHVIGVIGGTDADLRAAQLRQCGAEFYGALREALYYGESDPIGSARSSRVLDQATHDAIGYVALEFPKPRLLPVIERDDVVVIGGDDDGSMRTAPLGVLSGAVVVSVTGSSPR